MDVNFMEILFCWYCSPLVRMCVVENGGRPDFWVAYFHWRIAIEWWLLFVWQAFTEQSLDSENVLILEYTWAFVFYLPDISSYNAFDWIAFSTKQQLSFVSLYFPSSSSSHDTQKKPRRRIRLNFNWVDVHTTNGCYLCGVFVVVNVVCIDKSSGSLLVSLLA